MTESSLRPLTAEDALRLLEEFVNTNDLEDAQEELPDPGSLAGWLVGHGLLEPGAKVDAVALERTIALREAIRALATANNGLPADAEAAAAQVNATAVRARLEPRLSGGGQSVLVPRAGGIDAALGQLVAAIHRSATEGLWSRFKACERDTCRFAFVDHSRNRSGRWCSMAVCGSREKSKRAYRRRRGRKQP
jgi:predicted RNA-binding Zn ribbon-like protein